MVVMTTCNQILVGAIPRFDMKRAELVQRINSTTWPTSLRGKDGDPNWGVPLSEVARYAHDWVEWLQRPLEGPKGKHELLRFGETALRFAIFSGTGKVPLVMLHGWPTSSLAFHRVIEPLTTICSDLILVTLPGFSESRPTETTHNYHESAELILKALTELGVSKFVVHGQDWGSVVAREIGVRAPTRALGVHVSAGLRGFIAHDQINDNTRDRLRDFLVNGGPYIQLQSRRPNSLAIGLSDSPVGMLAWQLDKYKVWQDGLGPDFGLGLDFIFGNATFYWMTNSIYSSLLTYAVNRDEEISPPSIVPTAVSVFGKADFSSKDVSERNNNIVAWYEHANGGHVASLDAPSEFVSDLADFIVRIGEEDGR